MDATAYQTSPIRLRRSQAEVENLADSLFGIIEEHQPVSVRQAFYLAVSAGLVPKVDEYAGYGVVQRHLLAMRRAGRMPYDWIEDESRFVMGPDLYGGLAEFLEEAAHLYRRDVWLSRPVRVQVWCEKLSIAGVLSDVTRPWAVQLYPARGFSGETFVWQAAQGIRDNFEDTSQQTAILWIGDLDPSGSLMDSDVQRRLETCGADGAISDFRRLAVTREQVKDWSLPTRPTKRKANTHAKRFRGRSVEIEAVPPVRLREMLESAILSYLDTDQVEIIRTIEAEERIFLQAIASRRRRRGGR